MFTNFSNYTLLSTASVDFLHTASLVSLIFKSNSVHKMAVYAIIPAVHMHTKIKLQVKNGFLIWAAARPNMKTAAHPMHDRTMYS